MIPFARFLSLLGMLLMASAAHAAIPALFSDHMVLQQGMPVPVWGTAKPGTNVQVRFGKENVSAVAGEDGKWKATLPPLKASAEPAELSIDAGEEKRTIHDCLVGEVWLCSGQSNMAMSMPELPDAKTEMSVADYPNIRMLRVPEAPAEEPWNELTAQWKPCSPANASTYSAFAYYFSLKVHQQLKTPIGLVLCAWGGSAAHAWASRDALDEPLLRRQLAYDILGWRDNSRPTKLFNGMLHPLIPYAVHGVIWYQGETEGEPPQNSFLYRMTFPAMITDWRRRWGTPDLPFYFVQLPTLRRHDRWAVVREGQGVAAKLPHTGMIVTLDIGEPDHLHPMNKRAFGERMAFLVLAREYHSGENFEFPTYQSMQTQGSSIRIRFNHGNSLHTTDGAAPVALTIAGSDRNFVPAEGKVEGDGIIVSAAAVSQPMAVRYAWGGDPKVNLVNDANLPAAPFRTDDWPVLGSEMMWQKLPARAELKMTASAKEIVAGKAEGWKWTGEGVKPEELETRRMSRVSENHVQLAVPEKPLKDLSIASPALTWAYGSPVEIGKGFTAEMKLQVYRFSAPLHGIELALVLKQSDGKPRSYRIEISPMRLYGYKGNEIHILGYNLNNCTTFHTYRIAVRPDGTAQVYFDDRDLGVLPSELIDKPAPDTPLVEFGKRVTAGDMTVNVQSISFDSDGAFQPAEEQR